MITHIGTFHPFVLKYPDFPPPRSAEQSRFRDDINSEAEPEIPERTLGISGGGNSASRIFSVLKERAEARLDGIVESVFVGSGAISLEISGPTAGAEGREPIVVSEDSGDVPIAVTGAEDTAGVKDDVGADGEGGNADGIGVAEVIGTTATEGDAVDVVRDADGTGVAVDIGAERIEELILSVYIFFMTKFRGYFVIYCF